MWTTTVYMGYKYCVPVAWEVKEEVKNTNPFRKPKNNLINL